MAKKEDKKEAKVDSKDDKWLDENPAICRKCLKLPVPLSSGKLLCDCGIGKCELKK